MVDSETKGWQIMTVQTTAEEQALALARQHGMSLEALAARLLYDLCAGVPAAMSERLLALYHATHRLLRKGNTAPSGGSP